MRPLHMFERTITVAGNGEQTLAIFGCDDNIDSLGHAARLAHPAKYVNPLSASVHLTLPLSAQNIQSSGQTEFLATCLHSGVAQLEPVRPATDRNVLEFVKGNVFDPADFTIRPDGVCRLNPEMARCVVGFVNSEKTLWSSMNTYRRTPA